MCTPRNLRRLPPRIGPKRLRSRGTRRCVPRLREVVLRRSASTAICTGTTWLGHSVGSSTVSSPVSASSRAHAARRPRSGRRAAGRSTPGRAARAGPASAAAVDRGAGRRGSAGSSRRPVRSPAPRRAAAAPPRGRPRRSSTTGCLPTRLAVVSAGGGEPRRRSLPGAQHPRDVDVADEWLPRLGRARCSSAARIRRLRCWSLASRPLTRWRWKPRYDCAPAALRALVSSWPACRAACTGGTTSP